MSTITYTFPDDAPAFVRGKTVTGGVPSTIVVDRKVIKGVQFQTEIDGKKVFARLEGKPDLQVLVDQHEAAKTAASAAAAQELEAAVPGLRDLRTLAARVENQEEDFRRGMNRMMEDESNDGVFPPRQPSQVLREQYEAAKVAHPRAALYLRAERQAESASWADNTGKGAAGRDAMQVLESGGSLEDAEKALAQRRNFTD